MRKVWNAIERYRVTLFSDLSSRPGNHYGLFIFPSQVDTGDLRCIVSDGDYEDAGLSPDYAWEHVSVSRIDRTPTWEEMTYIKEKFWTDEENVIQFHPPKSEYVNYHPFCLHLWKPLLFDIPRPPRGSIA